MRHIILTEERSMKRFLEVFLEKFCPDLNKKIIPHEGKSDLKKSIPQKLQAFSNDNTKFIILIDQDNCDCMELKEEIVKKCSVIQRSDYTVRIVCHELESWYLGDLFAIGNAFNKKLIGYSNKAKFRNPDKLCNAKEELRKHIGIASQIEDRIVQAMTAESLKNNRSHSFHVFLKTIGYVYEK